MMMPNSNPTHPARVKKSQKRKCSTQKLSGSREKTDSNLQIVPSEAQNEVLDETLLYKNPNI
jgi:hypothetical protein